MYVDLELRKSISIHLLLFKKSFCYFRWVRFAARQHLTVPKAFFSQPAEVGPRTSQLLGNKI